MNKSDLKNLALASYKNNELSWKRISKIIKHLNKPELRHYIKLLKMLEKQKTISIILPKTTLKQRNDVIKKFAKIYKNKKIDILENKDMVLGIKIIDNDLIYEYNLNHTLNNIKDQIIR